MNGILKSLDDVSVWAASVIILLLLVGEQVIIGKLIGILRGRNSCGFHIITVIKIYTYKIYTINIWKKKKKHTEDDSFCHRWIEWWGKKDMFFGSIEM